MFERGFANYYEPSALKGEFIWGIKEGRELFKDLTKEIIEEAIILADKRYKEAALTEKEIHMNIIRILNFVKYKQISFAAVLFGSAYMDVKLQLLNVIDQAIDKLS